MSNITRVVAIDPAHPEIIILGTSDLTRVGGMYYIVHTDDGRREHMIAAFVFLASATDKVQSVMLRHKREEKELKDRHYKELVALRKDFGPA